MPRAYFHRQNFALVVTAMLAMVAAGCGKKESPAPAAGGNPASNLPATEQPQAIAPSRATPAASPDASLAAAQTAMKAKDYERAAVTLLAVQQQKQPLTAAQGEALRNQMVSLQQALAAGVASGDPKAKAAADLLRKSTMR